MECQICNIVVKRQGGHFNNHIKNSHNINDYESYVLLTKYLGVRPLCKCGCGEKTNFFNGDYREYYHGHNTEFVYNSNRDIEVEKKIINFYLNGVSVVEMCDNMKLGRNYIYKVLKTFGVNKSYSSSKQKYKIDEDIFSLIDTEEKAYWLGFLFADGYNHTSKFSVALTLSNCDFDILEKFKKFLKTDKPIRRNNSESSKVVIENKKISKDLEKIGMVKAKTHILFFPKIEKKLERHFIRGYFDGDGCISYGKNIDKGATISIVSNKQFLEQIERKINVKFSYTKRHKNRNDEIFTLNTGGVGNIMKFYHYIYEGSSIFMDRKRNKFDMWLENYFNVTNVQEKTKRLKTKLKI